MKFYNKLPDMECIAGDTLPTFTISVSSEDELTGCSMQVILARCTSPDISAICKDCTLVDESFRVQLTSDDTGTLSEGAYDIHFRFIGANGLSYRKLIGKLYVHSAAHGGDTVGN